MCRRFGPLFWHSEDWTRSFGGIFSHPPTPKRSFGVLKLPILTEFDLLGPKFHFPSIFLGPSFSGQRHTPISFRTESPPTPTRGCEQTLCHLPMFSAVIRSFGPPRLKRLYQIQRWNRDVGNLMNVTPAIQGYFSSNFSFWLCAVHPTAAQCGFGILSHLTGHYPARDGSPTQSTWCYIRKYVFVNFLRISNENVKYKLVKSPYLLSVS